ncbi:hypothetical protein IscW_ISCW004428 [Ixodes scapularis]|uniref:Uncharacterized protein n=1 Tax=Ixodes scapularis TaxID=6945 RepID=B7PHE2_IXOSC|nr:hypothetical protein IscW_ISCW004428 [Ixodes scapularis]|eukprot:XP_002402695.1 hypothetical protein IscW_ISCW004428 [Ixodes scapularis]
MPDMAPKVDHTQVPAAASVTAADPPSSSPAKKNYSRDFLLGCARSPYAAEVPPDFPSLDPNVANLMVKQHTTPFDSSGFRQQRMMCQASTSDFVSSSPVSSTPPRSELPELDDGSVG